jgi:hypothetical protein
VSVLTVHGEHLIRALDVNLAQPSALTYPIFDSTGSIFQGGYYTVDSFATWQFSRTLDCPFPPCINPLGRPIAQLGAINEFQSAASSYYNGATLSINRRVARGTYLRISYTYARAIDDGQDALVAGQPATVQNSYVPGAERGPSVTDQRQRVVAAFSAEPHPFHRGHEFLGYIFNDFKISTVVNYGSGRPFNATVAGDPNQDGNDLNDRLPGYSRNAFTGPDYATTDLRLTKTLRFGERYKLNLIAESFNLLNRDNQRVTITSNGMVNSATTFVTDSVTANIAPYPGYYQLPTNFMKPRCLLPKASSAFSEIYLLTDVGRAPPPASAVITRINAQVRLCPWPEQDTMSEPELRLPIRGRLIYALEIFDRPGYRGLLYSYLHFSRILCHRSDH